MRPGISFLLCSVAATALAAETTPDATGRDAVGTPGTNSWDSRFRCPGVSGFVDSMLWDGKYLYVGGHFDSAGSAPASNIARWDGSRFTSLGAGIPLNGDVRALAWDGTGLYVGGDLWSAGGIPASRVARWDSSGWSALGTGVDSFVYALTWDASSSSLCVGGWLNRAGDQASSGIARWLTSTAAPAERVPEK